MQGYSTQTQNIPSADLFSSLTFEKLLFLRHYKKIWVLLILKNEDSIDWYINYISNRILILFPHRNEEEN
jgi:hypothetical protein